MKRYLKRILVGGAVLGGIVLALALLGYSMLPSYPYGPSHCCLKCLGLALVQYAETHGGHFPAGAGSPEASLSLLYCGSSGINAEILRGKTVPVEKVRNILERGELLGPDSCGWHYVEGLTTSDDLELALVWDKIGLGHNGQDIGGGHAVCFLDAHEEVVRASEWPDFLKRQEKLMATRKQNTDRSKGAAPPDQSGG
jgi:hypothetical protein